MPKNRMVIFSLPVIAVLFALVLYQYGYQGIQSEIASLKERQEMQARALRKYVALISEKPRLEKKLVSLKKVREAENAKLMEGQTPSLTAAALQETVKGVILGRGGRISSERVGKPEDLGKFKIITVSMDIILPDTRALSDILYSLETRTPNLFVKEFDSRVNTFNNPKELAVKLDVSALTGGK